MADDGPDLDGDDIDSIVDEANAQAGVTPEQTAEPPEQTERSSDATEALLEQAEADLQRALSGDLDDAPEESDASASQFEFRDLGAGVGAPAATLPIESLQDVELDLRIELGRTELLIDDVMKLAEGSVVQLDKLAGDPVDVLVNGRLIARGEVLVLNDNFCVRVAEILTPDF